MDVQTDPITGFKYYEKLPEIFRIATVKDFEKIGDAIKDKKPFLILGYHWPVYQCNRVDTSFTIEKIKPWLEKERVFVLKTDC